MIVTANIYCVLCAGYCSDMVRILVVLKILWDKYLKNPHFTDECGFHQKCSCHCIYWINGIGNEESGGKPKIIFIVENVNNVEMRPVLYNI